MEKQYKFSLPLLLGLFVAIGMFLGTKFQPSLMIGKREPIFKIKEILNALHSSYMDTVNDDQLINEAAKGIFNKLDPHSIYIEKEDLETINEELQGDFEGIGITFNIFNDTIRVLDVNPGGPANKKGILPGDEIITINKEIVSGKSLKSRDVINRIRGKQGTVVKIGVFRNKKNKLEEFDIPRDKIELKSIDAAYMIDSKKGYIKLSMFSAKSYNEFLDVIIRLKRQGLEELILDISDNPGGYLNTAFNIADEFFGAKKLLVYTASRVRDKVEYYSTGSGSLKKVKLVILINENSASASEILAGAIQDWDRGIIIGRRSFGKGLVQEQIDLSDKSAIRLTVAKYFTPSGRCIQKSYNQNKNEYYNELLKRYEHGELTNLDSVKFPKGFKYQTTRGRIVYGGGGIMPDVFVPMDTSENSAYYFDLTKNNTIYGFALQFVGLNREKLHTSYATINDFDNKFQVNDLLFNQLISFAEINGIKRNNERIKISGDIIKFQLKALIARQLFDDNGYYQVINHRKKEFQKAIEIIDNPVYWKLIGN